LQASIREIEEKKRNLRPMHASASRERGDLKGMLIEASEQAASAVKAYVSFENH